jgi:hypothetical protein
MKNATSTSSHTLSVPHPTGDESVDHALPMDTNNFKANNINCVSHNEPPNWNPIAILENDETHPSVLNESASTKCQKLQGLTSHAALAQ